MFLFLLKYYACLLWIIRRRDVYFLIIYYNCVIYRFNRNRVLHTVPHWDFLTQLCDSFKQDEELQALIQGISHDPTVYPHFEIINDLVFFKGKLYIPSTSPFKQTLLEEFHASQIRGHSGINKTWGRLKENVYWQGMKANLTAFVNNCQTYQITKHSTHAPYGLL